MKITKWLLINAWKQQKTQRLNQTLTNRHLKNLLSPIQTVKSIFLVVHLMEAILELPAINHPKRLQTTIRMTITMGTHHLRTIIRTTITMITNRLQITMMIKLTVVLTILVVPAVTMRTSRKTSLQIRVVGLMKVMQVQVTVNQLKRKRRLTRKNIYLNRMKMVQLT